MAARPRRPLSMPAGYRGPGAPSPTRTQEEERIELIRALGKRGTAQPLVASLTTCPRSAVRPPPAPRAGLETARRAAPPSGGGARERWRRPRGGAGGARQIATMVRDVVLAAVSDPDACKQRSRRRYRPGGVGEAGRRLPAEKARRGSRLRSVAALRGDPSAGRSKDSASGPPDAAAWRPSCRFDATPAR